jgi:hypothetical protein
MFPVSTFGYIIYILFMIFFVHENFESTKYQCILYRSFLFFLLTKLQQSLWHNYLKPTFSGLSSPDQSFVLKCPENFPSYLKEVGNELISCLSPIVTGIFSGPADLWIQSKTVTLENLKAVNIEITVTCDVTPCSLVDTSSYHCLQEICYLYPWGQVARPEHTVP